MDSKEHKTVAWPSRDVTQLVLSTQGKSGYVDNQILDNISESETKNE